MAPLTFCLRSRGAGQKVRQGRLRKITNENTNNPGKKPSRDLWSCIPNIPVLSLFDVWLGKHLLKLLGSTRGDIDLQSSSHPIPGQDLAVEKEQAQQQK